MLSMLCVSFQFKKYSRACIYFTSILYHYCIVKVNYFSAFFLKILYTTNNATKISTPTRKTQKLQSVVINENNDIKPNADPIATKFPMIPTTAIAAPITKNATPTQYRQSRFRSENFISSIPPLLLSYPTILPRIPPPCQPLTTSFFIFSKKFPPTISLQKKTPTYNLTSPTKSLT